MLEKEKTVSLLDPCINNSLKDIPVASIVNQRRKEKENHLLNLTE